VGAGTSDVHGGVSLCDGGWMASNVWGDPAKAEKKKTRDVNAERGGRTTGGKLFKPYLEMRN